MVDFMYMWKEVEHWIPLGMIFKKMYWHKCENIIEYKKQVVIAKIQKKNKNKIVNIENEMIEKQS